MRRRTLFSASLLAVIGVAAIPSAVHADPPDVFHASFDDNVENVDVCGINVDIHSEGVFTDKVFLDREGNIDRFMSTSSGTNTFTADNGASVVVQFRQQYSETDYVIDEAAGTISFLQTYKGLPERILTPHGPAVLRDAGLISFRVTFDLETGELISQETVVNRGPHPEADSDFELFCELITDALS